MTPERYAALRALYEAVAEQPEHERAERLRALTEDVTLAAEVLAIFKAGADAQTGLIATPILDAIAAARAPGVQVGDSIGVWQIRAEIGQGGMGSVYRVDRCDGHFEQTAALKLLPGLPSREQLAYFSRERQLLARLTHPNIARLYDGGTTQGGQPYLVMEYVAGEHIDQYCLARQLGTEAILRLFIEVCRAVAFAHRQLIVHCDIKPSNILIDGDGRPVLLDFGISRLSDSGAPEQPVRAFTPRYASPEQRAGAAVGTASDIYSLGLLLSELLGETARKDRELAAAIAKASAADPLARYPNADALSEDLDRYRHQRPLRAMPPRRLYLARKFARRHWPWLVAAGAATAMALGFTLRLVDERDRARKAEREARASEVAALQTTDFLTSLFKGAHPDAGTGTVPTAVLIDESLKRVERDLAEQPATQAQMYAALGRVLFEIGQAERGRDTFRRAIALERAQDRPLVLAKLLSQYIDLMPGHFPKALPVAEAREALRLVEQHADLDPKLRLEVIAQVAGLFAASDHADEAAALFERATPLARAQVPGSLRLADLLARAGWQLRGIERYDDAVRLMQEANALTLRHRGEEDEEYVAALATLAGTLGLAGRFDEADATFRQALALRRKTGQIDSSNGAWTAVQYAMMLVQAGRAIEALPLYEEAFAIGRRKLAPEHATYAIWNNNYALALAAAGDTERAAALAREAIVRTDRDFGPEHRLAARFRVNLARHLADPACQAEAGAALVRARAILEPQFPPDDDDRYNAGLEYADWLTGCARVAEAAAVLSELGPHGTGTDARTALRAAQVRARLGLARDGAAALEASLAAERQALAVHGAADPRSALARLPRAEWLYARGRHPEAASLAQAILDDLDQKLLAGSPLWTRVHRLKQPP